MVSRYRIEHSTLTLMRWKASSEWTLKKTIGGIDDPEILADRVLSLDFSPDGSLLAIGGGDPSRSGQISIWNIADGSLVRSIQQPHSDTVFGLAFSPDGEYLASASADRTAKVFRTADGELVRTFARAPGPSTQPGSRHP